MDRHRRELPECVPGDADIDMGHGVERGPVMERAGAGGALRVFMGIMGRVCRWCRLPRLCGGVLEQSRLFMLIGNFLSTRGGVAFAQKAIPGMGASLKKIQVVQRIRHNVACKSEEGEEGQHDPDWLAA